MRWWLDETLVLTPPPEGGINIFRVVFLINRILQGGAYPPEGVARQYPTSTVQPIRITLSPLFTRVYLITDADIIGNTYFNVI